MKDLRGRVAVVTGAASGIGRATATLLAQRGMLVVLADIERTPLDEAVTQLQERGLDAHGVVSDVTSWASMQHLRDETLERHGTINVAFLNAGVAPGAGKAMWEIDLTDWTWAMNVNVWGVIHGIRALVPAIVDSGQPGHVVITSSSVGVIAPTPGAPVYNLTKAADCSLAESLHGQFRSRGLPIGASVMVPPGTINTGLFTSARNRPADLSPAGSAPAGSGLTYEQMLERMNRAGNPRRPVQPEEVAEYVVEGIENDRFWILPDHRHADIRDDFNAIVRARAASILEQSDPMTYMQRAT